LPIAAPLPSFLKYLASIREALLLAAPPIAHQGGQRQVRQASRGERETGVALAKARASAASVSSASLLQSIDHNDIEWSSGIGED
jgi:hypothetical protein